jgi:ankyrin repeat protein
VVNPGGASFGVLHLMAKRNNAAAVKWLLEHNADPNALWTHWDAKVTPLHMATMEHHTDIVRALLDAGADPSIRDSKFDSDAIGWAEFFRRTDIVQMLRDFREEK